jgi:hypothetical protein
MKRIQLILILLFVAVVANAQRHSGGTPGIELGAGVLPADNLGYSVNLSYLKYLNDASTLKLEATAFQYVKTVDNKNYNLQNYAGGLAYYYTPVTDRKSLFINTGIGCYAGYENINKLKEGYTQTGLFINVKSKFVALPFIGAEIEYFLFGNTALVVNIKEIYSPMSDVRSWHTIIGLSIRQIIF